MSTVPLVVFSLPGVPVYDGVRLFLPSFLGITLFAARGWAELMTRFKTSRLLAIAVPTLLVLMPLPWTMQPFAINQYGALCGGNRGAAALGLEACYWNDSLNRTFWEQIPRNAVVHVAPVSHPFQLNDLELLVPVVSERNIQLKPYLYAEAGGPPPKDFCSCTDSPISALN
ncbi:MAG UNVERIFIED_CONTAM: hypothetical protein LVR18_07455 [Planctomycetaceae bacterium]